MMMMDCVSILTSSFVIIVSLVYSLVPALPQDKNYHNFADQRPLCTCVPNTNDVLSNIAFAIIGLAGIIVVENIKDQLQLYQRITWHVWYFGSFLVSLGSAYYHLKPNNQRLVWDRLPMTIAFMSLYLVVLEERLHLVERFGVGLYYGLLGLFLSGGIWSVVHWRNTDDLRAYAIVQFYPIITMPAILIYLPAENSGDSSGYWRCLSWYILAKALEYFDRGVFKLTCSTISGHTLKHLVAAVGIAEIILDMQNRISQ